MADVIHQYNTTKMYSNSRLTVVLEKYNLEWIKKKVKNFVTHLIELNWVSKSTLNSIDRNFQIVGVDYWVGGSTDFGPTHHRVAYRNKLNELQLV